jgi:adenosylhomocysteine nucleosidase
MPKVAIVAAIEREVHALVKNWARILREHEGRTFAFFERNDVIVVCGGIGLESARRAAEAVIALYHPAQLQSVGFAGALDSALRVGDILAPSLVIDARDGSRTQLDSQDGTLVTFMAVAAAEQKTKLARAYGACAVDMEAAAVAAAARAHGIPFGVTKVISDELNFEMPAMARFIGPDGRFKSASFIRFVGPRPWLWKRVASLARNSNRAARALAERLRIAFPPISEELQQSTVPAAGRTPAPGARVNGLPAEGRK